MNIKSALLAYILAGHEMPMGAIEGIVHQPISRGRPKRTGAQQHSLDSRSNRRKAGRRAGR
jgi:hypothetical protein